VTVHNSCKAAIKDCIEKKYFSVAYLFDEEKTLDLHIHDCYEIFYSISGAKKFLIGEKYYDINPGDVFVINQFENHHVSVDETKNERIVISVFPDFLESISTGQTDLAVCFCKRDGEYSNKIALPKDSQQRFVRLCHKITGTSGYGADIIERAAFTEIMVMLNDTFQNLHSDEKDNFQFAYNRMVNDVIQYINAHIGEKLTVSGIAGEFFVSESYLCRIFKLETGTTMNKYLNSRRISIAKALLKNGASATEACAESGFNDYANFVKTFKKSVGIPPKQYARMD